jgi:hypothetical protein
MRKQTAIPATPAQGSGGDTESQFNHTVTQEDLNNNPELVENGVKVGDVIQVPEKEDVNPQAEQLTAETPEWVERLIASNESVIKSNESLEVLLAEIIESGPAQEQSNQAVVDVCTGLTKAFEDIKALAAITSPKKADELLAQMEATFDETADYEVAAGKSFRDPNDFTKEYTEGDDITHLDGGALRRLYAQGLIEEA